MLPFHRALLMVLFLGLYTAGNNVVSGQSATNMTAEEYTTCPRGKVSAVQILSTVTSRSEVGCFVRCSQTAGCESVNVCPMDGRVTCVMLKEFNTDTCADLVEASSPDCYYAQKRCHHGGRQEGHTCHCTLEFTGGFCERYIRDCGEANSNGWGPGHDGVYLIHPVAAPAPFRVYCTFDSWGGGTLVFRRRYLHYQNMNWTSARDGYGEDLALSRQSQDFFVGLENMRYVTMQAPYTGHFSLYNHDTGDSYGYKYERFNVGPESTSYNVSYTLHYPRKTTPNSTSLFGTAAKPVVFATQDRDTNGCASLGGAPSWYASDCTGSSVFRDPPMMPSTDGPQEMNAGKISLERGTRQFYIDQ